MSTAYQNPLRSAAGLVAERVDQGVDYSASGPIYALGPGTIVETANSGWPGGAFIAELLSAGPFAGRYVYAAENITPEVQAGQHVDASTRIGTITGGIETGFAAPPPDLGESLAIQQGQWGSGDPSTAYGELYSRLLASLGAPPGVTDTAVSGSVPAGFGALSLTGSQGGPGGLGWNPLNWPGEIASSASGSILSGLITPLENAAITIPIVLAGAAVGVAGLIMATRGPRQRTEQRTAERGAQAAGLAAAAA
jgi:hypothetical protein